MVNLRKIPFLPFCIILLLSGFNELYAHTHQASLSHSTVESFKESEQVSFGAESPHQFSTVRSASSGTEKGGTLKISDIEIEEEDEKHSSLKKKAEYSDYLTDVVHAYLSAYFSQSIKTRLPLCKHFSYFLPYRWHLVFRVFRI